MAGVHRSETADEDQEVREPEGRRHGHQPQRGASRQRDLAHPFESGLDARPNITSRVSGESLDEANHGAKEAQEEVSTYE